MPEKSTRLIGFVHVLLLGRLLDLDELSGGLVGERQAAESGEAALEDAAHDGAGGDDVRIGSRYRTSRPSRSASTIPAARRTERCWETLGWLAPISSASRPTSHGPSARRWRISSRRGFASVFRTSACRIVISSMGAIIDLFADAHECRVSRPAGTLGRGAGRSPARAATLGRSRAATCPLPLPRPESPGPGHPVGDPIAGRSQCRHRTCPAPVPAGPTRMRAGAAGPAPAGTASRSSYCDGLPDTEEPLGPRGLPRALAARAEDQVHVERPQPLLQRTEVQVQPVFGRAGTRGPRGGSGR